MSFDITPTCPTCGQSLPGRQGRICGKCHKQMKREDRWHIVGSMVQHVDCEDTQLAKVVTPPQQRRLEETA